MANILTMKDSHKKLYYPKKKKNRCNHQTTRGSVETWNSVTNIMRLLEPDDCHILIIKYYAVTRSR